MAENSDLTSNIFNFFYDPNLIINIPDKSDYLTASVATYRSTIYSAAKLLVENAKLVCRLGFLPQQKYLM